jgi:hypothetical protein
MIGLSAGLLLGCLLSLRLQLRACQCFAFRDGRFRCCPSLYLVVLVLWLSVGFLRIRTE